MEWCAGRSGSRWDVHICCWVASQLLREARLPLGHGALHGPDYHLVAVSGVPPHCCIFSTVSLPHLHTRRSRRGRTRRCKRRHFSPDRRLTQGTSPRYQCPVAQVKAGQDQAFWEDKGWIDKQDPRGWFQWYCRFYQGKDGTRGCLTVACAAFARCCHCPLTGAAVAAAAAAHRCLPTATTHVPTGRRTADDARQISRWKGVVGDKGRWVRALCNKIVA